MDIFRTMMASLVGLLLVCSGCDKENDQTLKAGQILFLGHIYQPGTEDRIDGRIEAVAFDQFDVRLLGGDLCVETTKDPATLAYLDDLFDLSDPNTHWSLGKP